MNKTLLKSLAPVMLLGMMVLPASVSADPQDYGRQHGSGPPPPPFGGGSGRDRDHHGDRDSGGGELDWSGDVDDTVIVTIHGDTVDTNTVHGRQVRHVSHDVSGRLPHFPVHVSLRDQRGRGDIQVIEQPHPDNGFTARVRIHDGRSGASRYHFVLTWQADGRDSGPHDFHGADRRPDPRGPGRY